MTCDLHGVHCQLDFRASSRGARRLFPATRELIPANVNLSLEVYGGTSLIAVDDFNGDGTLDILQAMGNDFTNSISLGRGDGTFRTAQFYNYAGPSQAQNHGGCRLQRRWFC